MACRLGGIERTFRLIIGLIILAFGIYIRSWWGILCAPFLISGVFGWCILDSKRSYSKVDSKTKSHHHGIEVIESPAVNGDGLGSLGEGDSGHSDSGDGV